MAAETRPTGDDRQVDARRIPAGPPETGQDLFDEPPARDPLGGPGVGREESAQVALSGGAQQGVGQGVQDDVAVGVTGQPRRARDLDPAEPEWLPRTERVAVVPDPGARARIVRSARRPPSRDRRGASP